MRKIAICSGKRLVKEALWKRKEKKLPISSDFLRSQYAKFSKSTRADARWIISSGMSCPQSMHGDYSR